MDKLVTRKWILDWEVNVPGLEMLLLSCAVAVIVNLSQFLCLGRFTATSFQVGPGSRALLGGGMGEGLGAARGGGGVWGGAGSLAEFCLRGARASGPKGGVSV